MATTQNRIDTDNCDALTLYKTLARIVDALNDKNVKDQYRKPHAVSVFVEAAQHYVPSHKDKIPRDADGNPNLKHWPDNGYCNNKPTWEDQGITKGYLPGSIYLDANGEDKPIPMLMSGIEIDPESDEYQEWYRRFIGTPPSVIPQIQAEINQELNKYFDEPVRSNRKMQGPLPATERLRDYYIQLQNMVFQDRSKLRMDLITEIAKQVRTHKQVFALRHVVESTIAMIEMTFALPFGAEDSMMAINFVNAQIDVDENRFPFTSEHDKMSFQRALFEAKLLHEKNGKLDLTQLFDKLMRTFRTKDVTHTEEDNLQSAMAAQMQHQTAKKHAPRNDYQKKSSPPVMRRKQAEHTKSQEEHALGKILKTIYDLKAEVGSFRKALDRHGISIDGESDPKPGKGNQIDKQKPKFAGIAKKKSRMGKAQSKSLVPDREISITDSDEEVEEQCYNVMAVVDEPKRASINYRAMSAKLSSMTRFDHADLKEAAYKMNEELDDHDIQSVEDEPIDSTMWKAQAHNSPEPASVQHSEGDSVQGELRNLSVMSIEDDMQLMDGEEPEQQASDEEDKDTPLACRTRSARASKPRRFILPQAIMPDTDSDQELVDEPPQAKLKGKPKNKYYRQVLRKLRLKTQVSKRGF